MCPPDPVQELLAGLERGGRMARHRRRKRKNPKAARAMKIAARLLRTGKARTRSSALRKAWKMVK